MRRHVGLVRSVGQLAVDPPQRHFRVPRAGHQELVVQPAHVEHPVPVATFAHANGVQGRQSIYRYFVTTPRSCCQQCPMGVSNCSKYSLVVFFSLIEVSTIIIETSYS